MKNDTRTLAEKMANSATVRYYHRNREAILAKNKAARAKARGDKPKYDRASAMKRLWQTRSPESRSASLAGLTPGNPGNTGRRSESGKVVSRMDAIALADPEIRRGR